MVRKGVTVQSTSVYILPTASDKEFFHGKYQTHTPHDTRSQRHAPLIPTVATETAQNTPDSLKAVHTLMIYAVATNH